MRKGKKVPDITDIADEKPKKRAKKSTHSSDEKPETVFSKDKPKSSE